MDNLTFLALVTTPNPSDRPSEGLAGPLVEGCNNQYGCCEDGVTPANGPDQEGCPGKSKDADSFLYSWDGYTSFVENSVAVFPSTLAFEFGKTTQQHVLTYLLRIAITNVNKDTQIYSFNVSFQNIQAIVLCLLRRVHVGDTFQDFTLTNKLVVVNCSSMVAAAVITIVS